MRLILALIVVLCALLLVGCGSKTVTDTGANGQTTTKTVANVHFAKTKFLLHSGLAVGAFHRYLQKPYQAGSFKQGAPRRKRAIAKAAVASLFAYHELRQARDAAESSDVLRRKLVNPIDGVLGKLQGLATSLKAGSLNPADIVGAISGVGGLASAAAAAGAVIKDRNAPIPGT